jgi:hypothetical protein
MILEHDPQVGGADAHPTEPRPDCEKPAEAPAKRILLYSPSDVWEAYNEWGANCGPGALAALAEMPVDQVRLYRPVHAFRGYMNPTHVEEALRNMGFSCEKVKEPITAGMAHVQWSGSWEKAGPRVAYKYTHWIAYHRLEGIFWVYDINTFEAGGWLPIEEWEETVVPELLPKKATGHHIRLWIEAERRASK